LTTEVGVAAIPPSAFYSAEHRHLARHHARFCFCKSDETLELAAKRLAGLRRAPG
jgi:aspartate/methionine/tyrosine aminotransferase